MGGGGEDRGKEAGMKRKEEGEGEEYLVGASQKGGHDVSSHLFEVVFVCL